MIQDSIARLAYLRDYCFLGTRFEMLGRCDEDGLPLPFSPDPDGMGAHHTDMELLLHHTQCILGDLRGDHIVVITENRDLLGELDDLRVEHDITTARN